ncbi:TlpA disulfide reductase family protein, partial [Prosthecobacter sp.]|uniref:TlpA disulfide reductase family protein n=1 Tax=Prosthecobacter sp. TaxID=1965333 RepID=UPI002487C5C3
MKLDKVTILILAVGTAFAGWAFCNSTSGRCGLSQSRDIIPMSSTAGGESSAPEWALPGLDGKTVKLSDFRGKVVVLNFWATWCPPCRREIPDLVALHEKYAEQGLVVIGVSLDEGGATSVKSFVTKAGVKYPVVMGDQETAQAYGGITSIPTTFI